MIKDLGSFQEHFTGVEDCYVLIGSAASNLVMSNVGEQFHAIKELSEHESAGC